MDEALKQEREATLQVGATVARAYVVARRLVIARRAELACAVLLVLMAANLLAAISRKSITNDEIVHIPAGYYHLVDGYFQLNNEHPPLVKMWAALPLLFIQPNEALPSAGETKGNFSELMWSYHQRFWPNNKENFETICYWTRAMMVAVAVALGVLIFTYARNLFGARAAVFAVALYTLEPTVLAHGRIVHTDVPAALVYLLFFFALRHYLNARTLRRALLVGLACGVALITKFSMIVVLPVLALVTLGGILFAPRLRESRKRIVLHAVLAACVVLFVVNAAYYFKRPPLEPADVQWVQTRSPDAFNSWMTFFRAGSKIVPTYYLFGQYNVLLHNRDGHPTSLLGQYNVMGWWYYFPVAFALKTSLPFLFVSIAALTWALWRLLKKRDARFLWLLVPFAAYALLSMSGHINIGVRHFLPAYPFLFIAGGALLERLTRVRRPHHLAVALVVLTFGWMCVEALRAYPDYVPYMNQLASSHPRWWYLSDSNVEWGDDARELAGYLHARGEREVRGAVSGGWGTLAQYGIAYHEIFPKPGVTIPETRYVAIGAGFLNGSTISVPADAEGRLVSEEQRINYLADYRTLQPEAVLGHSIYVYRVK
ncbi:MAG: glycosyltransferase family 39 protein [Acidobacteria bacterium]|nr:glycosyltransferase family 39 protein [Acidobacteriota bacterium]